jgi:hypothetical protein
MEPSHWLVAYLAEPQNENLSTLTESVMLPQWVKNPHCKAYQPLSGAPLSNSGDISQTLPLGAVITLHKLK